MHLTSLVSYNEIIERDMFQKRIQKNKSIGVLELIYPILQGYDSVAMDIDVEVGGTDQTFNMLMGRQLVRAMQAREKFVMTTPLLTDAQGRKIGKTEGNVIALTDKPEDLFAKIMALPDEVVLKAFEYLTDVPMDQIRTMEKGSPMENKKKLAFAILKQLNSEQAAKGAQEYFEKTVQKHALPTDIPVQRYTGPLETNLIDLLLNTKIVQSRSEGKRLLEQGGVKVNESEVRGEKQAVRVVDGMMLRVGKRRFVKLTTALK